VITCIDSDGNSNDYDICDGTTDFALLEDCTEILIDGEPLPGFDIDIDIDNDGLDGLDGYGFDFDSCDFVITCIDADGISTDYDPCDETVDFNTLVCVELLIDGIPIFDLDDFNDNEEDYGYDSDDYFDFDDLSDCDYVLTCIDSVGISTDYDPCDESVDFNTFVCVEILIDGIPIFDLDDFINEEEDYGYDSYDDYDFDFDDFGDCDFVITCIDSVGISTDYDPCDETVDFNTLVCVELLIDGIPIFDLDDFNDEDNYSYDYEECDIVFECVDAQGNEILINICDTTIDWNSIECDFGFDDFDYDEDYDYYDNYGYDCTSVITCIDENEISTEYDACDETVDFITLECVELLIDGIPVQDFGDFDFDDIDFPDDTLWFDWDCDTLFSIIVGDDIDTLVINPCDEDALEDLLNNFDCIYNDTIDCPWDTTGFYVWGDDGREFSPMSTASIVGLDDETASVNVSTIYPNPTSADFSISLNAAKASQINVKVFSVTGQQISDKLFNVNFGINNLQMNIDDVPNGIYQVYLFDDIKMISTHKLSVVK